MEITRSFFRCHCGEDFADLGLDDNEVIHDPEWRRIRLNACFDMGNSG